MARRSHHHSTMEKLQHFALHSMSNGNWAAITLPLFMSTYGFFAGAHKGWTTSKEDSNTATKACWAALYSTCGAATGLVIGLTAKQAYLGLSYLLLGSTHSSSHEGAQSILIAGATVASGIYFGSDWQKTTATICAAAAAGLIAERFIG